MKAHHTLLALTLVNLALFVMGATNSTHPLYANGATGVLRGRGLEIVDERGRVRASIQLLPEGRSANGVSHPETVLLRLITERGRPSVKIGASESAAGMSLAGPTGTKDTYVVIEAKETASSLKLRSENGREKILAP